jgi:hypothetical protein
MRRIAVLFLAGSSLSFAQLSSLPATSPTSQPAPAPVAAAPAAPSVPAHPGHPATVTYTLGQLEISADNSSLNQILREISRLTGMAITGGVADQRVFGKYGPGRPADILSDLLAGTGSNMLLMQNASNVPAELILTPQQGGPTPPNPNAPGFNDDPTLLDNAQPANQPPAAPIDPNLLPRGPRFGAMPVENPQTTQSPSTGTATTGADPNATPPAGTPSSPNAVPTPQQIYEQLQQLQRAQPKQ